jgi:hypothetical protein
VHLLSQEEPRSALEPSAVALCLYRDASSYDVRVLSLTPVTAVLLQYMAQGNHSLTHCAQQAAAALGATVDAAWVQAFSTVLADWLQRGLVLGSLQ